MASEDHPPEVSSLAQPHCLPRLAELPVELLFRLTRYFLGVGQERDASALAQTNKRMHFVLNAELYRLVIKHRTYYILHWAVQKNNIAALKIALAHGADPNQLCTLGYDGVMSPTSYRPVGWGLNNDFRLDRSLREQRKLIICPHNHQRHPAYVSWSNAWFSSPNISLVRPAPLKSLWHHYYDTRLPLGVTDPDADFADSDTEFADSDTDFAAEDWDFQYLARVPGSPMSWRGDTGLDELSSPVDDGFAFHENMSKTSMDERDVKIAFVRLFRYWNTPLHLAALYDRTELTEALLANGADVDSAGNGVCSCKSNRLPSSRPASPGNHLVAYTPLHVAICNENYSTAKVLVAHGAQRMAKLFSGNNDRSWFPENALHTALSMRSSREGVDYDEDFDYGFIEFLLRNGYAARIEERNHEGLTPLLLACNGADSPTRDSVVELLLRYGANVDNQGFRPPHDGVSGPWPQPRGSEGQVTPALWAARKGQFQLCKLLLEHGADISSRSSGSLATIFHDVCSAPNNDLSVSRDRIDLFDYVLANSSDKELNAFDVNGLTPLSMLVRWNLRLLSLFVIDDTEIKLFGMGSRMFGRGADILAGIKEGRKTPFEFMIEKALDTYNNGYNKFKPSQISNKVLTTMQASWINQHPDRPTAFLNRFWGFWGRAMRGSAWRIRHSTLEMAMYLVQTLIKGGFSPSEVDSRGDNAMASFLKHLIDHPRLVVHIEGDSCGSFLGECHDRSMFALSIIAVLQESGAACHVKNEEGYTAFDYWYQITDYGGPDRDRAMLAGMMGSLVRIGEDDVGNMCFKFHPTHGLFGSLDEESTLQITLKNPSRWLVCERWCRAHCLTRQGGNGQCGCAGRPFRTFARCDDTCLYECEAVSGSHIQMCGRSWPLRETKL